MTHEVSAAPVAMYVENEIVAAEAEPVIITAANSAALDVYFIRLCKMIESPPTRPNRLA